MNKRGQPFQVGNTFGRGRPPGSKNKKSLALQGLLLENGEEIISTLIERAKQGDRVALTLCVERLIPRLKDVAELPIEQSQEDSTSTPEIDLSKLTDDEFTTLDRLTKKARRVNAESDGGRAATPEIPQDRLEGCRR